MMLLETRVDARGALVFVDAMLNQELPSEEPPAASAQSPA